MTTITKTFFNERTHWNNIMIFNETLNKWV
jgi:hypothetical protein